MLESITLGTPGAECVYMTGGTIYRAVITELIDAETNTVNLNYEVYMAIGSATNWRVANNIPYADPLTNDCWKWSIET